MKFYWIITAVAFMTFWIISVGIAISGEQKNFINYLKENKLYKLSAIITGISIPVLFLFSYVPLYVIYRKIKNTTTSTNFKIVHENTLVNDSLLCASFKSLTQGSVNHDIGDEEINLILVSTDSIHLTLKNNVNDSLAYWICYDFKGDGRVEKIGKIVTNKKLSF